MRATLAILFTLAIFGACSPAPAPPAPAPPSPYPSPGEITATFTGIVVIGEGWRLEADPFFGMSITEHGRNSFSNGERLLTGGASAAFRYMVGDVSVGVTRSDCLANGVRYPLTATLDRVGRPQLSGCGFEQWAGRARNAVKIADACAPVGPNARRITLFQVSGDGAVLVRLRGEAGGVDCRIVEGRLAATARDASLKLGGEGELDLIRAAPQAPSEPCIASNVATDADGNLIGWLVLNDGKCRTAPMRP
jgi:hypothetical protein